MANGGEYVRVVYGSGATSRKVLNHATNVGTPAYEALFTNGFDPVSQLGGNGSKSDMFNAVEAQIELEQVVIGEGSLAEEP